MYYLTDLSYPDPCRIQSCMECLTFVSQTKRWVQSVDKVLASGVSSPAMSLLASETHAKVGRPSKLEGFYIAFEPQNNTKHIKTHLISKVMADASLRQQKQQKSEVNWCKTHKEHFFFDTSAWARTKGLRSIWISATLDVASWRIWA